MCEKDVHSTFVWRLPSRKKRGERRKIRVLARRGLSRPISRRYPSHVFAHTHARTAHQLTRAARRTVRACDVRNRGSRSARLCTHTCTRTCAYARTHTHTHSVPRTRHPRARTAANFCRTVGSASPANFTARVSRV